MYLIHSAVQLKSLLSTYYSHECRVTFDQYFWLFLWMFLLCFLLMSWGEGLQSTSDANLHAEMQTVYLVEDLLVFQNVYEGKNKYGSHVNGQGYQEHEKVSVVTTSDAVVDPRAVMVKDLQQRNKHQMKNSGGVHIRGFLGALLRQQKQLLGINWKKLYCS